MSRLVLSLFPGIDMLGRGFEAEGFCVVRGPDLIFGGDIRRFSAPAGKFDGIIAGSPCPDFSRARRGEPSGDGLAMLAEFRRIVFEALPEWYLLENVAGCPDVLLSGYSWQRIDLDARDAGLRQRRLRHFQFGHSAGKVLVVPRVSCRAGLTAERTCTASEAARVDRRGWEEFCELQGLPRDFDLPGMSKAARYRAVGNGVPPAMGRVLARAILRPKDRARICACGCARPVVGRMDYAGPACRKRAQRRRDAAVNCEPRPVTVTAPARPSIDESQIDLESVIARAA
jgi:DNA (cytosine-5)-methyltransferase 1